MTLHEYNPVAAIERIASEIHQSYPDAAVGLLTAATAIEVLLQKPKGDELDRQALTSHWNVGI